MSGECNSASTTLERRLVALGSSAVTILSLLRRWIEGSSGGGGLSSCDLRLLGEDGVGE